MTAAELYSLRQYLTSNGVLLCFNGPISRSLIVEFGNALKRYLEADQVRPAEAMDVFSVYIEVSQNIRQYALARGYSEDESSATIVISRSTQAGKYTISAGNLVEIEDGEQLVASISDLAGKDKTQLKADYKQRLRQPRDPARPDSVGLGLIEIARRATAPLQAALSERRAGRAGRAGRAFFSLSVVI